MNSRDREFWSFAEELRAASADGREISYPAAERFYRKHDPALVARSWRSLTARIEKAYRWDVWAVGAILIGRLSPEFALDYLTWIILQGPGFYRSVLRCPARAAERCSESELSTRFDLCCLHTAILTVERRTRTPLRDIASELRGRNPAGTRWSWRDLRRLHPQLWDRFFVNRDRRPSRPTRRIRDDDYKLTWQVGSPLQSWVDIYDDPSFLEAQYRVLAPAQRLVHAVLWLKIECDNGGIDQFFYNSTGVVARKALEGLRLFGADASAEILAKVMAAFPGGAPARSRPARRAQMKARWGPRLIYEEFQTPGFGCEIEEVVAQYIRDHPECFFRPSRPSRVRTAESNERGTSPSREA